MCINTHFFYNINIFKIIRIINKCSKKYIVLRRKMFKKIVRSNLITFIWGIRKSMYQI